MFYSDKCFEETKTGDNKWLRKVYWISWAVKYEMIILSGNLNEGMGKTKNI